MVSSNCAGIGKSLFIQRMAEKLSMITSNSASDIHIIIPIHGPTVTCDLLLKLLKEHYSANTCKIYHIDIDSRVSAK